MSKQAPEFDINQHRLWYSVEKLHPANTKGSYAVGVDCEHTLYFDSEGKAEEVCDALELARHDGYEHLRRSLCGMLGVSSDSEAEND